MPYHNTPTTFTVVPLDEGFTDEEVATITAQNGSVMGNNNAGSAVICGAVHTTYKTNSVGLVDLSYDYLNYRDTATSSREYIFNSLKADYAQKRLTSGTGVSGYSFANVGSIRADIVKYLGVLQGVGYVLIQSGVMETGETVMNAIKRKLKVEADNVTGAIVISSVLPLVTQVRDISIPLNIVFNPAAL